MSAIASRFITAAGGTPPTDDQRKAVADNAASIVAAAEQIDAVAPDGRHKSLALTALEEALMWANKAVFSA